MKMNHITERITKQITEQLEGTELYVHQVVQESIIPIGEHWYYGDSWVGERTAMSDPNVTSIIKVILGDSDVQDGLDPAFIGVELPVYLNEHGQLILSSEYEFGNAPDHDWTNITTINEWAEVSAE